MNENSGNSGNDFFYDLLDSPAALSHSNAFNLQLLINEYPQSGLLRSMLAVKREEEGLQRASAYVNPKLLYKIANAVGSLQSVSDEQIVICQKPGEVKPVLPLPVGLELPNLAIDESNYFHVPIDPDLVYKEDEKAEDVELIDEHQDLEAEQVPDIDQALENNTEVAEESESEESVVTSSETDTIVAEENETKEEADPSPEINTEVAEKIETEEAAIPSSEIDTEAAEESETEENVPSSQEIDANLAEEGEADHGLEAESAVAPVSDSDVEETDQVEEQPALSAEPNTEEVEIPETEEAEANEADANASATNQEHSPQDEQAENAVETEDNKIGSKPIDPRQEIDDEVFEEIVSIEDIGLEQLALMDKVVATDEAGENVKNDLEETEEAATGDSYFVFEPTLPEDEEYHAPANIATQSTPGSKDRQHVSRYNDEKMPYSFMWWLDKTRKEHAAIYQPFAVEGKFHTETVAPAEKPQPAADHLQQQYVENIFAVSSVVSDLSVIPPKVSAPPAETKADKIIEKFIHEEPQIKHPSKVKLDSENKAKKSSEDRDELVTETLAKIYTEQMLYHKAILTYKKLMLKFPEKSLYFAGQIEQLENKIN